MDKCKKIIVHGTNKSSEIIIEGNIASFKKYIKRKRVVVLTDSNLKKHYGHYFSDFETIEIGLGEKIKTLETIYHIYGRLLNLNIDRTTFILAIGGGIVCDIAGFVASTYMRGISFGFVSTSLLSQVDASVGGKNGVNFHGFKNIVGVFNQPEFVLCIPKMLKTLPKKQIANGFAEVIKYACIADKALFHYLEKNVEEARTLDDQVIKHIIYQSIQIKSSIVSSDERELGIRRILNFGHTIGHAIEKEGVGYMHGEAVGLGMLVAAKISEKVYQKKDIYNKIKQLLNQFLLPTDIPENLGKILKHIKKDKKKEGDFIHFILLEEIGKSKIYKLTLNELEELII